MKNIIKLSITVILSLTIAACVQVPVENNTRASQLAVSSVRDLPISYPQGSLFSLSPKYVEETSLKPSQTQNIYKLYTNAIISDLQNNGFTNSTSSENSMFHVGFGVALADDFSEDNIDQKFGLSPGLPEQANMKKGSFLIYIEDAKTGERVWRGIAQGFAHEELSDSERKTRTQNIVSSVMKQFYQTN